MKNEELKILVHDIYIQYRYLFQNYRKEVSHFSRNGKIQEWTKNRYEFKER